MKYGKEAQERGIELNNGRPHFIPFLTLVGRNKMQYPNKYGFMNRTISRRRDLHFNLFNEDVAPFFGNGKSKSVGPHFIQSVLLVCYYIMANADPVLELKYLCW